MALAKCPAKLLAHSPEFLKGGFSNFSVLCNLEGPRIFQITEFLFLFLNNSSLGSSPCSLVLMQAARRHLHLQCFAWGPSTKYANNEIYTFCLPHNFGARPHQVSSTIDSLATHIYYQGLHFLLSPHQTRLQCYLFQHNARDNSCVLQDDQSLLCYIPICSLSPHKTPGLVYVALKFSQPPPITKIQSHFQVLKYFYCGTRFQVLRYVIYLSSHTKCLKLDGLKQQKCILLHSWGSEV